MKQQPVKIRYRPLISSSLVACPNIRPQKWLATRKEAIFRCCQQARALQGTHLPTNSLFATTSNYFTHSAQSTLLRYLEQKRSWKDAFPEKHTKEINKTRCRECSCWEKCSSQFCFSQSNILTIATCIERHLSTFFAMGNELASLKTCCYPKVRKTRRTSKSNGPFVSLVSKFDQSNNRFIY